MLLSYTIKYSKERNNLGTFSKKIYLQWRKSSKQDTLDKGFWNKYD